MINHDKFHSVPSTITGEFPLKARGESHDFSAASKVALRHQLKLLTPEDTGSSGAVWHLDTEEWHHQIDFPIPDMIWYDSVWLTDLHDLQMRQNKDRCMGDFMDDLMIRDLFMTSLFIWIGCRSIAWSQMHLAWNWLDAMRLAEIGQLKPWYAMNHPQLCQT